MVVITAVVVVMDGCLSSLRPRDHRFPAMLERPACLHATHNAFAHDEKRDISRQAEHGALGS